MTCNSACIGMVMATLNRISYACNSGFDKEHGTTESNTYDPQ